MKLVTLVLGAALAASAADPQVVVLWPNGAPGSEGKDAAETVRVNAPTGDHVVAGVHRPSITVYLPSKATNTGAAVVIAPGGGHSELWVDHEGYNVARWLSEHGVAGFVLKYRLAREKGSTYTVEGNALADMQRAIRTVRSRAAEWGVDPARVGVMGFSAGGEVAALASMHYGPATAPADAIDRQDAKPAFQALIYPGLPRDMKPTKEMPPAFLACGENDRQNISQGLPELYLEMKRAGVSAELHVYTNIGHGFGMRASDKGAIAGWIVRFREWMDARGYLAAPSGIMLNTTDIPNFWKAYDASQPGIREKAFQKLYLDAGSAGLADFVKARIQTAKDLADAVDQKYSKFYATERPYALQVEKPRDAILQRLDRFHELYPEAHFPPVYFAIGRTSGEPPATGKRGGDGGKVSGNAISFACLRACPV